MDLVARQARIRPEAPAVVLPRTHGARVVSYGELDVEVERAAEALREELAPRPVGHRPPPVVGLLLPPSIEALVQIHAVWRVGATLLPMNPGWPTDRLRRVVPRRWVPELVRGDVGATPLPGEWGSLSEPPDPAEDLHPRAVLLSSGTDGAPSAVPITEANLEASARGSGSRLGLGKDDVWLWTLSPGHVGGLALVHRAAWMGSAVLPLGPFSGPAAAALLDDPGFTHASLVPIMLTGLLDAWGKAPAPPGLRCLLLGGAATPRTLVERAHSAGFPVALTYGLTQATSQVTTNPPESVAGELAAGEELTAGFPLDGVGVEIVAPDHRGVGEIRVSGATVALPTHSSGRLDTGDLGALLPDGRLRVMGRRSTRIITGGVNVEPAEVEEVLLRHPSVAEVAVLGRPDPRWGERVVAVVVPSPGHAPPTAGELLAFSRGELPAAARPREVVTVPVLPRNPNGKVDLVAIRDLLPETP